MIESLQTFIQTLRDRGVSVSAAEAIDAARALEAVGPESRERVRTALALTLAKDLGSQGIFEDAFDTFFTAPPATGRRGRGRGSPIGGGEEGGSGPGGPAGSGGGTRPPASHDQPPGSAARALKTESTLGPSRPGLRALGPDQIRRTLRLAPREGSATRPAPEDVRERGAAGLEGRTGAKAERAAADGKTLRPGKTARPVQKLRLEERNRPSAPALDNSPTRPAEPARSGRASASVRIRLQRLLGAEARSASALTDPRRRDLSAPMTTADEERLAREIPRLIEEIRLRHGRRRRRAPRGRLWMKGTIREALKTGGVPFRLPAQARRPKRPRIVLLVDVSWSVARAGGLFLLLALEFVKLGRSARVFLFVDHPSDATQALARWQRASGPGASSAGGAGRAGRSGRAARADRPASSQPEITGASVSRLSAREGARRSGGAMEPTALASSGWNPYRNAMLEHPARGRAGGTRRESPVGAGIRAEGSGVSFREMLDALPGLDLAAASDYGRAFYALGAGPLRSMPRDTILVVLGDGRTNVFDPLPWAFEDLATKARRVIWLATESRARWGTDDSALPLYLPFCDVAVEARDLDGLVHGMRELLASLRA